MTEKIKDRLLLVAILITCIACLGFITVDHMNDKPYTIERSTGDWMTSETNYPDTVIIDTINIDGIVTFNTTQYIRVNKQ